MANQILWGGLPESWQVSPLKVEKKIVGGKLTCHTGCLQSVCTILLWVPLLSWFWFYISSHTQQLAKKNHQKIIFGKWKQNCIIWQLPAKIWCLCHLWTYELHDVLMIFSFERLVALFIGPNTWRGWRFPLLKEDTDVHQGSDWEDLGRSQNRRGFPASPQPGECWTNVMGLK
jgi:hypothetical protein